MTVVSPNESQSLNEKMYFSVKQPAVTFEYCVFIEVNIFNEIQPGVKESTDDLYMCCPDTIKISENNVFRVLV